VLDADSFGYIPKWHAHQRVRNDEAASVIPDPKSSECVLVDPGHWSHSVSDGFETEQSRVHVVEGKGKEGKQEDLRSSWSKLPPDAPRPKVKKDSTEFHKQRGELLKLYRETFEAKHGHRPDTPDRVAKELGQLIHAYGFDAAMNGVAGYFQLPDPALMKTRHPAHGLQPRWEEIKAFQLSGNFVPWTLVRKADQALAEAGGPVDPWEKAALFCFECIRGLSPGHSGDRVTLEKKLGPTMFAVAQRMPGSLGAFWKLEKEPKGKTILAGLLKDSAHRLKMSKPTDQPSLPGTQKQASLTAGDVFPDYEGENQGST
jgi:hypothetical protein